VGGAKLMARQPFFPLVHAPSHRRTVQIPITPVPAQQAQAPAQIAKNLQQWGVSRLPVTNFMPAEGREFRPATYVPIPLQGAQAVVVQFTIPQGYNAMINALANVYVGGGFQEGQGAIYWTLYSDFTQKIVVPNFDHIVASLGSVNNAAKLNGIRVKENQVVTLAVNNLAAPGGILPAGQLIGGMLGGYYYPIALEPPTIGF
jgi:hypothetical protein